MPLRAPSVGAPLDTLRWGDGGEPRGSPPVFSTLHAGTVDARLIRRAAGGDVPAAVLAHDAAIRGAADRGRGRRAEADAARGRVAARVLADGRARRTALPGVAEAGFARGAAVDGPARVGASDWRGGGADRVALPGRAGAGLVVHGRAAPILVRVGEAALPP